MTVDVRCICGHIMAVSTHHAGKVVPCSECQRGVKVPAPRPNIPDVPSTQASTDDDYEDRRRNDMAKLMDRLESGINKIGTYTGWCLVFLILIFLRSLFPHIATISTK
jgi:hypothetical protein